MSGIRARVTEVFVIISLALGRVSHAMALLDLLQRPSAARVIISRRRHLAYGEFFSETDREGRRAAPIDRRPAKRDDRSYVWVDTA